MAQNSNIDWTDSTWNPIRGCSPVSPGCKNCYAAKVAQRFSGPGKPFEGLVRINAQGKRTDEWSGKITFAENHLLDPLKWGMVSIEDSGPLTGLNGRRRRIFVNSVSDLFHENVTDEMRDQIFAVMALCPQHVFQVLTKRPQRMAEYFLLGEMARVREAMIGFAASRIHLDRTKEPMLEWSGLPLKNVLLGASVENQQWADERRLALQQISDAGWHTMVSYEPALGPVDFRGWGFLDWLISGGESQAGARPSHPDWHRAARYFALANSIPYFFKQWGEWAPYEAGVNGTYKDKHFIDWRGRLCGPHEPNPDGLDMRDWDRIVKVKAKKAGHLLDGREHRAFPEGF
jgi:protein gp37